ncbi:MAG: ribulose-phosphate 3-epimerase [Sumerlaeia bacterium]
MAKTKSALQRNKTTPNPKPKEGEIPDPPVQNGTRRGKGVHLAPSLLAADFSRLEDCVKPLKSLCVNWLHLDIMDGNFVPNISFGPAVVKQLRPIDANLYFDVHLMIADPRAYIKPFCDAGADNITFHVEAAGEDSMNLLRYIRRQKIHAGISIKPKTPVSDIKELLKFADLVLVMTVEPGFGGQALIPSTLNKVRELSIIREELGLEYMIQVDGGINTSTAPLAVAAGADVLVAGSSFYEKNRIRQNARALRQSLNNIV